MEKNILRKMSYGIYIVSTMDSGRATGCAVNSAMQINVSPETVAISINRKNFTHQCIAECGLFAITLLAEESNPILIGRFGFCSGRDANKFQDVDFKIVKEIPVLTDTCGYAVCKVINKFETETHTVFLGEVIESKMFGNNRIPMTYSYYQKVVKGV